MPLMKFENVSAPIEKRSDAKTSLCLLFSYIKIFCPPPPPFFVCYATGAYFFKGGKKMIAPDENISARGSQSYLIIYQVLLLYNCVKWNIDNETYELAASSYTKICR